MTNHPIKSLATPIFILLLSQAGMVSADDLSVEPGKWEMTSTVNMPFLPEPKVTTNTQCLENTTVSAEDLNLNGDSQCTLTNLRSSASDASWDINCPTMGGSMTGSWQVSTSSSTMQGSGEMQMAVAGQNMEMSMTWSGRRIGDCE